MIQLFTCFFLVDTGIAHEKDWGICSSNQNVNESRTDEECSTWYRDSTEDFGENGYRYRWDRQINGLRLNWELNGDKWEEKFFGGFGLHQEETWDVSLSGDGLNLNMLGRLKPVTNHPTSGEAVALILGPDHHMKMMINLTFSLFTMRSCSLTSYPHVLVFGFSGCFKLINFNHID